MLLAVETAPLTIPFPDFSEAGKLDTTFNVVLVRDSAPSRAHFLRCKANPGSTYNVAELYKYIIDVRIFGFNNDDPGLASQSWIIIVETKDTHVNDILV